jgi:hypothetical protein
MRQHSHDADFMLLNGTHITVPRIVLIFAVLLLFLVPKHEFGAIEVVQTNVLPIVRQ